jgi:nitroimidazol reductase NimA-like FMN-containing flavoprotein (pyridoxamine 5'-phosphate oxidase superfamily)
MAIEFSPRQMRRKDRALDESEFEAVLKKAEYASLATVNPDGSPYAVPLSFVLKDGFIYVHSSLSGHKLDNILREDRVCFTAVGDTERTSSGSFSTNYESIIIFGRASLVSDNDEKYAALYALSEKYFPLELNKADAYIKASIDKTAIIKLSIEHITGKARRHLGREQG